MSLSSDVFCSYVVTFGRIQSVWLTIAAREEGGDGLQELVCHCIYKIPISPAIQYL